MKLIALPWDRTKSHPPGTQLQAGAEKALPCAQPMDPMTKHLAWAFAILVAAVVLALNVTPDPLPPIACTATTQK